MGHFVLNIEIPERVNVCIRLFMMDDWTILWRPKRYHTHRTRLVTTRRTRPNSGGVWDILDLDGKYHVRRTGTVRTTGWTGRLSPMKNVDVDSTFVDGDRFLIQKLGLKPHPRSNRVDTEKLVVPAEEIFSDATFLRLVSIKIILLTSNICRRVWRKGKTIEQITSSRELVPGSLTKKKKKKKRLP